MRAFEAALSTGADGIELDVHLSRDGVPVIIHDETLERTTGLPGAVLDYDARELRGFDASKVQGRVFANAGQCPIPSLEEYCRWVQGTSLVTNIEIKTDQVYYPGIEEKTAHLVRRFGLDDRVIVSSFNWLSVVRFRALAPHIPCGLLRGDRPLAGAAALAASLGFEYYHPGFDLLDEATAAACKERGVGVNVWTVNSAEQFRTLAAWDVHGVISNYPDRMNGLLQGV
jgi:glycerophosphoryl diester phosphodiesterase